MIHTHTDYKDQGPFFHRPSGNLLIVTGGAHGFEDVISSTSDQYSETMFS